MFLFLKAVIQPAVVHLTSWNILLHHLTRRSNVLWTYLKGCQHCFLCERGSFQGVQCFRKSIPKNQAFDFKTRRSLLFHRMGQLCQEIFAFGPPCQPYSVLNEKRSAKKGINYNPFDCEDANPFIEGSRHIRILIVFLDGRGGISCINHWLALKLCNYDDDYDYDYWYGFILGIFMLLWLWILKGQSEHYVIFAICLFVDN